MFHVKHPAAGTGFDAVQPAREPCGELARPGSRALGRVMAVGPACTSSSRHRASEPRSASASWGSFLAFDPTLECRHDPGERHFLSASGADTHVKAHVSRETHSDERTRPARP